MKRAAWTAATLCTIGFGAHARQVSPFPDTPPPASPPEGLRYDEPFFPGADHDPAVRTVEALIGFRAGERAATHAEIERCFRAWADAAPDRVRFVEYARTHGGRPCFSLVVSTAENMRRLDEIRDRTRTLADPRRGTPGEQDRLAQTLPAVAWLAYTIHGDETTGSDAALAVAHHLIADRSDETRDLLRDTVVIIDPVQNPDGRDRFLKQIREHIGREPNVDDQSLLHTGYWPRGRMNHYLFDMNRDWIFATQPETRGRIEAVNEWTPMLFVDSHEMSSQDTFLFSPSREPVNPHFPSGKPGWWERFAADKARAFDAFGWRYYTGEWNEGWYPGYSDAWASFRGAVGILYEQARLAHDGVRRQEGTIEPYRMGVHKQVVASMTNLRSLRDNRVEIMRGYLRERREAVDPAGPFAGRMWAVLPTTNRARFDRFLDLMLLQGFEVYRTDAEITARGTDRFGRSVEGRTLPPGTLLIPARQPEANLLAAMLDFDPRMEDDFLERERRELLRFARSRLYDVSSWNITMMHDLEALTLEGEPPAGLTRLTSENRDRTRPPALAGAKNPRVGWVIDGADDRSVAAAARLMERGVRCRVALKPFEWSGTAFSRGSIIVTRVDNSRLPGGEAALVESLRAACGALAISAVGVDTGFGPGHDGPDLGGENFRLLERPRIALLSRGWTNPYSYGTAWWLLDHEMGVRTSHIDAASLGSVDLRRYNTLIVPDVWWGDALGRATEQIKEWVRAGGTLILIDSSAAGVAVEGSGLSAVRRLSDVLADTKPYELQVLREWEGRTTGADPAGVWRSTPPRELAYPWEGAAAAPDADERKKRDQWQLIFMPQGGAMLAARTDDRHWLTAGLNSEIPLLYTTQQVLVSGAGVETPVRIGVYTPAPKTPEAPQPEGEKKDATTAPTPTPAPTPRPRIGFAPLPAGQDLIVRAGGLVWPEAAHRLAHAAVVTREPMGSGQVILFATEPVFRGATRGTARLFMNAAVLGPGLGASHPIEP